MRLWIVLFATLMLMGCSAPKTLFVAHRGASFDAPENTLAAVNLAWERGADGVEVDVYLTADGKIICLHDRSLKRTTGLDRFIDEMLYDELVTLDAGSWKSARYAGEPLPLLDDVLRTIPPGRFLLIEVKCGPEIVEPLRRVLEAHDLEPAQTRIISFGHDVCAAAMRAMPDRPVYYLSSFKQDEQTGRWSPTIEELIAKALAANLDGLDLWAGGPLDEAAAQNIRAAGLELHVWTVNDPVLARRMIQLRAHSITTDRPAWLRSEIK